MGSLEIDTIGYINYKKRLSKEKYSETVLQKIIDHRASILEKYSDSGDKTVKRAIGTCYAGGLLIPVDYDGVFVDADSVYAAAYKICYSKGVWKKRSEKFAYWILFTNDPYVPVLPMVCIQKYNPIELLLHKEKNELRPVIEGLCRNLKYPVCTMDRLEKTVGNEYSARGSASKDFVLGQIYDAINEYGLFDLNSISSEIGDGTGKLLKKYGFIY
ncbi:MAG: hypothetical protein MJ107_08500 [Lachnospiraceae bacterium]|nr:hypothetical protein [Lachnospiraceae bacterium]